MITERMLLWCCLIVLALLWFYIERRLSDLEALFVEAEPDDDPKHTELQPYD